MAITYSNSELYEIFKSDWTENPRYDSLNLDTTNFMLSFQMRTAIDWQTYVENFKRYLVHNNGFFLFSNDLELSLQKVNEFERSYQIVVEKDKILSLLNFLKITKCHVLKLCFGLNRPMGRRGTMQIIATGSFQENKGDTKEKVIDDLLKINGERIYFSNFDLDKSFTETEVKVFNQNFEESITNEDEKRVMGYMLSVNTLTSMLTKEDHLGAGQTIRFSFGMSKFDDSTDEGQIVMVKIDSPEITDVNKSYYLFDQDIEENDPFDCPPRKPCR